MVCQECEKLRERIAELEREIAEIATTRKMKLIAPGGIPVHVEIDIDTLMANEFLWKRIDEIDWGKGYGARIRNACANNWDTWDSEAKKPHKKPIVTIADLILNGHIIIGMGGKSFERVRQVLCDHDLSLDDQPRLKAAFAARRAA